MFVSCNQEFRREGWTETAIILCKLNQSLNKVLYQLVYIGKKFVFLKKNLGI